MANEHEQTDQTNPTVDNTIVNNIPTVDDTSIDTTIDYTPIDYSTIDYSTADYSTADYAPIDYSTVDCTPIDQVAADQNITNQTINEPVAEEPVAEELVAEEPVAEEPVAEEPVAEEPVAEEPVAEELVAEEPVAEEPVAEEPVAEEPVAEEPVAEEPVAEELVAEEPVAEELVAEELVAEEPVVEMVAEQPKGFEGLGLSKKTLSAIREKGFVEPTEIQALTIPVMLRDDTNIIAQAQTGTGKTAAFGLPLIEMIDADSRFVQAIILAPTRELAIQVSDEINSLAGKTKIRSMPIYGGQSMDVQLRKLKKGVHIVVGTPGRVIDHLNRKTLKLKHIDHLILDEADEMLNMGFIEDMEEIMKHTKEDKKTLLFSATMPKRIQELASKYMKGYELLKAKESHQTTNLTEQIYYEVKMSDKFEVLCRIMDIESKFYGLIFCRTRSDVDTLVSNLTQRGYNAEAIHGEISQTQRERTLGKFKRKVVNILVATDVAARGIDVNNMTHVINYSIPHDPEVYVHRIGRTGRAGNKGTAITFITPSEYRRFMFIQRTANADIKKMDVPKVKEIIKAKKRKIFQDLTEVLSSDIDEKYYNWAKKLLDENPPTEILAALLNYTFKDDLSTDSYREIREPGAKRKSYNDEAGSARLFIAMGKKDKISPRKLADLITRGAPVNHKQIKNIQIMDKFSFVTVPSHKVDKIMVSLNVKGKKPLITHAKEKA